MPGLDDREALGRTLVSLSLWCGGSESGRHRLSKGFEPGRLARFADFCSANGTLRTIGELFASEDFVAKKGYEGPEGGERRHLVASFPAAIDFEDSADQHTLLLVYLDAIDSWGRDPQTGELTAEAAALLKSLARDGAPIDGEATSLQRLPRRSSRSIDLIASPNRESSSSISIGSRQTWPLTQQPRSGPRRNSQSQRSSSSSTTTASHMGRAMTCSTCTRRQQEP